MMQPRFFASHLVKTCVRPLGVLGLALAGLTCPAQASPLKTLVLGDSLCAAYGIPLEQGWVNLLAQDTAFNPPLSVINACVSGETSAGGLARLPALLEQHKPQVVVIELGANDGLRGQPLNQLEDNLRRLIGQSQAAQARVLLVGMQIPPNYGPRYTQGFKALYPKLAAELAIPLVPFLLEHVALNRQLMQPDGLHPTAEAQPIIANTVKPWLLKRIQTP